MDKSLYNSCMNIVYSNHPVSLDTPSIFLAGPTLRPLSWWERAKIGFFGLNLRWRDKAIELLRVKGFSGTVFVPEHDDGSLMEDYVGQTEWEYQCLEQATVILFWVPRHMKYLPAFTTNLEFGRYVRPGNRVVYGRPDDSPKNKYLDWMYRKHIGKSPSNSLCQTINEALMLIG